MSHRLLILQISFENHSKKGQCIYLLTIGHTSTRSPHSAMECLALLKLQNQAIGGVTNWSAIYSIIRWKLRGDES